MYNNIFSNNIIENKVILTEQETAKVLGVSKKVVKEFIADGVIQAISAGGKTYITKNSLAIMTGGNNDVQFGQIASGQLQTDTVYYSQKEENIDCEDENMFAKMYSGSVSALKDGRFLAQIDMGKTPDGKRIRPGKSFNTRKEAEAYLNRRLNELNGVYQPNNSWMMEPIQVEKKHYTDLTFEEYSRMRLNEGVKRASDATIEGYRTVLGPVLKEIGDTKMVDIDEAKLRKLFRKLSYNYVDSTLKKAFNTVKMICDIAVKNEDIPKMPFITIECPNSLKPYKEDKIPYTKEEIEIIFEKSKSYHNKMLYPMFVLYECTGIRPGEMRAIEWKNLDVKEKKIKIKQALSKKYDEITDMHKRPKSYAFIKTTKSKYSYRELYLSDLAVDALLQWRKELDKMSSAEKNSIFIFPSEDGTFRTEASIRSLIRRFVESAGIKDMKLTQYRFRHTMCTRLILANVPLAVVQIIMGDKTLKVIMEIYTHIKKEQALASCKEYYRELNEVHSIMSVALTGEKDGEVSKIKQIMGNEWQHVNIDNGQETP